LSLEWGRPLIENLAEFDLKEPNGNAAVLTCGPGGLADDV
jgi:hypothetical protein